MDITAICKMLLVERFHILVCAPCFLQTTVFGKAREQIMQTFMFVTVPAPANTDSGFQGPDHSVRHTISTPTTMATHIKQY